MQQELNCLFMNCLFLLLKRKESAVFPAGFKSKKWQHTVCSCVSTTGSEYLLCDFVESFQCFFSSILLHFKAVSWGSRTSSGWLFSLTLSDIWDAQSAALCSPHSMPRPRLWPLSFTWPTRGTQLHLKPGPVFSNHVNRSGILLPKLTSFHLGADWNRRPREALGV